MIPNVETFYKSLGNQIKIERKKRGISQEFLAESLKLNRASIVNLEKGRHKPSIHQLIVIATILGVGYTILLPEKTEEKDIWDFDAAAFDNPSVKNEKNVSIISNFLSTLPANK